MTDAEILAVVRATYHEDWFGDGAVRRLKADHAIRIAPAVPLLPAGRPAFRSDWVRVLGGQARLVTMELSYRGHVVHRFDLVQVDGVAGYLPRPVPGTAVVRQEDYRLSRALTPASILAQCLERAGLHVEGERVPM